MQNRFTHFLIYVLHWERISKYIIWPNSPGHVRTVSVKHVTQQYCCLLRPPGRDWYRNPKCLSAHDPNMMSLGWRIIDSHPSPFFWNRYHFDSSARHSLTQTFTSQQNTLTLNQPPTSGWSSFSPTFYLSMAEVSQQRVQVPAVSSGVQRALSHHAESHAQGGPDVVRHHGSCNTSRPPCCSPSIPSSLAL